VTDSYKITDAREMFAELINRAAYQGARIVLERHGNPIAAIVSIHDVEHLETCPNLHRIDLTSTGPSGVVTGSGEPVVEPQRIAAKHEQGQAPQRPGFRS
jgi:prevent-host-death family protein